MIVCNCDSLEVTQQEIKIPEKNEVAWIRLHGAPPEEVNRVLRDMFHCHPLLVEDCMKLNQRPKLDRYKEHVFISFFAFEKNYDPHEMGIVLGENYIITVCKKNLPFLQEIARDFQEIEGRMDHPGEVLYHILDRCVDEYSEIIAQLDDHAERMERGLYRNPNIRIAQDIFRLKRSTHHLRRIFTEERTILTTIIQQDIPFTKKETDVYFTDIYDHLSREIDTLDIFRESANGLLELQMNMKADRMNEIMKTLTIISSIFLPLTFIVGVYGMNFTFFPELEWKYGYFLVWGVIVAVAVVMCFFYKRKKWL
ncbi:MAG TPA: magnesium/cobalt transporter CorA [Bacilli bacterium]